MTYIVRGVKSFFHSSKLKGDGRHKKQLKSEEKKKDSSILDPSASEMKWKRSQLILSKKKVMSENMHTKLVFAANL